jgi:hypothetical protein
VATYPAPLSTLGLNGAAIGVIASGFLDPSVNNNGPAFGLYVALPAGGDLVALSNTTGIKDSNFDKTNLRLYPNPAKDHVNVQFSLKKAGEVNIEIRNLSGAVAGYDADKRELITCKCWRSPCRLVPAYIKVRQFQCWT